jgi:hypothetical protein
MKRLSLALALLVAGRAAQAQTPPAEPRTSPLVHYGKWGAAALFVAFSAAGAIAHDRANADWSRLADYCRSQGVCTIGGDGRYTNPVAESMYWDVVRLDRAARAWLIGGQVALAGTVTLFIIELRRRRGPPNIPYNGFTVAPGRWGDLRLGWRLAVW